MAKRKELKRDIGYVAGELFTEVLVIRMLIPGVDQEQTDILLTRILDMQDDYTARAQRPGGKDPKIVKAYYCKLREDLQKEVDAIGLAIGVLSNGVDE